MLKVRPLRGRYVSSSVAYVIIHDSRVEADRRVKQWLMGKKDILAIRYECKTMLLILKEANDADVRSEIICKRTERRKVGEREDSEWMIRG